MKQLWRYTKRLSLLVLVIFLGLLSPVAYVETMCQGSTAPEAYEALLAPEFHRAETRTLMTYPEWDIVHAYEDYAQVVAGGDPHEFRFVRAIGGYWTSLCALTRASSALGEIDGPTKQLVYVIGVSFTAELLLKAAYEETIGRFFAALRGNERAPLDDLSAAHAKNYAEFLQQIPWYKWQFREDRAKLKAKATTAWRDRERRFALGVEYGVKAVYADVIADAVAQVGQDELTLRMIIRDVDRAVLEASEEVTILSAGAEGFEVETPRYRALTHLLQNWAAEGGTFVEIAGNDDILFTVLTQEPSMDGAIFSRLRQGFGDSRHLVMTKVVNLAETLRAMQDSGQQLEHIHDY